MKFPMPHPFFSDATPLTLNRMATGLWWGLQAMIVGLLILVAVRADNAMTWCGLIAFTVILVGQWWTIPRGEGSTQQRDYSGFPVVLWFSLLISAWAVMAAGAVEGTFVVFPIFFLAVYLFRPATSGIVVLGLTAAVILFVTSHLGWNIGAVTGPIIGAAVAWTLGVGFQLLHREVRARTEAMKELVKAREAALKNSRRAGEADERARLAGDIHDTVAQGLSSIHMLLSAADASLVANDGADTRAARDHIDLAKRTAAENLAETRRIIVALQPAPLEGTELPVALARLASETPMGNAMDFDVTGQPRELPAETQEGLLRVAQSLISNVVRHAHADRARVTLSFESDEVRLDVVDNGRGFDVDHERENIERNLLSSVGLAGVSRRVAAMGGTLSIESAPGDGTEVSLSVPLTKGKNND